MSDNRNVSVMLVWKESNPSLMEKNHLTLNGLEKSGVNTHAIGFNHSKSNKEYFENTYAKDALYSFDYGNERALYQGGNYFTKLMNNLYLSFVFFIKLYTQLRNNKIKIIIFSSEPIETALPVVLLGKIFNVKVIPNIMEYCPALPSYHVKKNLFKRWSWRLVTRYSDAYIVISKFLDKKLKQSYVKPTFILPAILASKMPSQEGFKGKVNEDIPLLIYASSKEYDDLLTFCIDSLAKIKNKSFLLVITGSYPDEVKERWLAKLMLLGLSNKVSFSGFLSDSELRDLQKRSYALLMPLLNNERHKARFPQKVLSYMQIKKPVIATNVGEFANYFSGNDTMFIDDTVSVDGFSKQIGFALDSPEEAKRIACEGSEYVEEKFNEIFWGKELKSFIQVVQEL